MAALRVKEITDDLFTPDSIGAIHDTFGLLCRR
jgi:hypothetical protein